MSYLDRVTASPEDHACKHGHLHCSTRDGGPCSDEVQSAAEARAKARADELARKLVCGVTSMDHLLSKWTDHHYRPTLRADDGAEYVELADLYDAAARAAGIDVQAYRG